MLSNGPSGQPAGGLYLAAYHTESLERLQMAVSPDGLRWSSLGVIDASTWVRDPSLLRYNSEWYVAHTGEYPGDGSVPYTGRPLPWCRAYRSRSVWKKLADGAVA